MSSLTPARTATGVAVRLGIVENWPQFSLLVLVNAFVGGMVGIERSILPFLAQEEFGLAERTAILSFIAVFGLTKAGANYFAGRLGDRWGRKPVLVAGWLIAAPVPFLLMWAPSWAWVIIANVFLGISQGLTWSTAVIMKIDLAGPRKRGLAMGLNEFAGYGAVAIAAWATGYIAAQYGLRPEPFYLGILLLVCGLVLSAFAVKDTHGHAVHEASSSAVPAKALTHFEIFRLTTWKDKNLSSATQAGLVNNLNDGLAWGLFPLIFASAGLGLKAIGVLAGLYPAVWGVTQLITGGLSDRVGRKWLIAAGMWIQAVGIVAIALQPASRSGLVFLRMALARQFLANGEKRSVHILFVIENVRREAEAIEPASLSHPQNAAERRAVATLGQTGGNERRSNRPWRGADKMQSRNSRKRFIGAISQRKRAPLH